MPAGAGGARPSARLQPEPSLAAPWQGRIPTDITADITRRTPPIPPTATIPRTAIATGQPITAMPLRQGPISAAGATGTDTAIACAERLPPDRADRQPDPALRPGRSAGLFFASKLCRPVPGTDQIPTN